MSEQQHNQDLKSGIYKGSTNSRVYHFLPECVAFNQSALAPLFIAPQTTRG